MASSLRVRTYWSRHHLRSAAHLLDLVAEIEPQRDPNQWSAYRGRATGSILLSIGFVEAAVNELYRDAAEKEGQYISKLDEAVVHRLARVTPELEKRRARLDEKLDLALTLADAPALDPGEPPRQDFFLAKLVRNDLVHPLPETGSGTAEQGLSKKRQAQLEARGFSPCPFAAEGNPYYPDKCIGYGCAAWVLRSSVALADEFFARLGTSPAYAKALEEVSVDRFDPGGLNL